MFPASDNNFPGHTVFGGKQTNKRSHHSLYIKFCFSVAFIILFSSVLYPAAESKRLTLKGLKIFSEKELYAHLELNRFEEGKISLAEVIDSIEKFYKAENYTLVKIFSTDVKGTGEYVLFIDEGRLGKIIVHNLNNYYSLIFKNQVKIPKRIYNSETVRQNLDVLKKKFKDYDIHFEIRQPPDYDSNLIQLNRDLQRLRIGDIIGIKFFDNYIPPNDLHFFLKKKNKSSSDDREGLSFDIDYKFPSVFIPQIYYYTEKLFFSKDYLETEFSIGFDPGFKGLFNLPPENTMQFPPERRFIELTEEYKVSPMQNDFIGPLLRGRLYHSNTTRKDLGIKDYKYLNLRGTLAPEITLLKHLNLYAGIGIEKIILYDTTTDYEADEYLVISDNTYTNAFTELRIKFDPIPLRLGNRIDKYIVLTYTDYFSGNDSNRLEVKGAYDAMFENLSILSFRFRTILMYNNSPFYKSEDINSSYFKGFSGESYYTDKALALSLEYRFSINQDYLYAGGFVDWIVFEPEGFFLSGTKKGVVYGPTARILIYDQFEFTVYFGWDVLYPDKITGTSLKMKLTKKW